MKPILYKISSVVIVNRFLEKIWILENLVKNIELMF